MACESNATIRPSALIAGPEKRPEMSFPCVSGRADTDHLGDLREGCGGRNEKRGRGEYDQNRESALPEMAIPSEHGPPLLSSGERTCERSRDQLELCECRRDATIR